MDEKTTMMVLETMAQMFETLVARIEATERRIDEAHTCSCERWRKEREIDPLSVDYAEMHK